MWSWTSSLRRLPPSVPQVVLSTNHTPVGVPDCEDAVYHPSTSALKWTAAALVALVAFPAHADVSGPACVTDGDTLVVNGKRERTRCVGGTHVRLFGIDAPELKQRCKHPSGRDFLCGRAAASFLLEHVRGRTVECRGNSEDRYGRLIAICFIGGKDLNAMMVSGGWALIYRSPRRHSHGGTNSIAQMPLLAPLATLSCGTYFSE